MSLLDFEVLFRDFVMFGLLVDHPQVPYSLSPSRKYNVSRHYFILPHRSSSKKVFCIKTLKIHSRGINCFEYLTASFIVYS